MLGISALLNQAERAVAMRMNKTLKPFRLKDRQYHVLAAIVTFATTNREPLSQKKLGMITGVDRSTLSSIIEILAKKRFIERTKLGHDRRVRIVSVTRLGVKTYIDARRKVENFEQQQTADLDPEARLNLQAGLEHIRKHSPNTE